MSPRNYGPDQRNHRQRSYYSRRRLRRFINARNSRLINNVNTIVRIAQITTPQITNNPLEYSFFNGTIFDNNNDFESLILPAGCLPSSSFS